MAFQSRTGLFLPPGCMTAKVDEDDREEDARPVAQLLASTTAFWLRSRAEHNTARDVRG